MKIIMIVAMCLMPAAAYAKGSSTSMSLATGVAVGSAFAASNTAANGRANGKSLSSESCLGRSFAVVQCYEKVRRTNAHRNRFSTGCAGPKGTEYSFSDIVEDTGLPDAEIANVIYDDYNDKFLVTICYGEQQ